MNLLILLILLITSMLFTSKGREILFWPIKFFLKAFIIIIACITVLGLIIFILLETFI